MPFEWKDYQKAIWAVYNQMKPNSVANDLVNWTFERYSNKEEEGMEEAWESLMKDVFSIIEANENETKENLRWLLLKLSETAKEQAENIDNSLDQAGLLSMTQAVGELKKRVREIKDSKDKAQKWLHPNWLRRVIH